MTALLVVSALLAVPAVVVAQEEFRATLDADQEVPAPNVPDNFAGSGQGSVSISDDGTSIEYEVSYEGLTGPAAASHIHWGAPGAAGPVILPLDLGADPGESGSFSGTLTEADFTPVTEGDGPTTFAEAVEAIREGNTYINIHTEMNGPGEIRGQLRALPDTATGEQDATTSGMPMVLLLVAGAAAFAVGLRRFALLRA